MCPIGGGCETVQSSAYAVMFGIPVAFIGIAGYAALLAVALVVGFSADVNLGTVGRAIDAVVDVRLLPGTTPEEFEARVSKLDAVRELAFVTGRFDYHLRVACRDTHDLNETVRSLRGNSVAAHTETRIVLGSTTFARTIG